MNSTSHGFAFSPADTSKVMSNERNGHEIIPILDINTDLNYFDEPIIKNDGGGLKEPEAEEIILLFLENPSTSDFQPPLEFPMFSVADCFIEGAQDKNI